MKQRIWELDALRGVCILAMVAIHLVYDLVELFALISWEYPPLFSWIKDWGGVLFLLISGVCATLGSRSVRRGCIVLCCGFLCTAVTYGMYRLGFAEKSILIYFGVLHCLGVCMLLWPALRRLPWPALAALGAVLVVAGFFLRTHTVSAWKVLVIFGFRWNGFASSDYFPLLPNLGFFLMGAALGKTLYREKTTLFPKVNPQLGFIRFFRLCGRQSLPIYLLHQPILFAAIQLVRLLFF